MTCANWMFTILGAVILATTIWPSFLGSSINKWVIATSAIIIIILAWTNVDCKACDMIKKE